MKTIIRNKEKNTVKNIEESFLLRKNHDFYNMDKKLQKDEKKGKKPTD